MNSNKKQRMYRLYSFIFGLSLSVLYLSVLAAPQMSEMMAPGVEGACDDISFAQAPEFATGDQPRAVALGDFDGDGFRDIAVVFQYVFDGTTPIEGISILRNLNAIGSFAPKIDLFIASGTADVGTITVSDLNTDGKPDIIVSARQNNKISVLRNLSSGPGQIAFAAPEFYIAPGSFAGQLLIADFDSDGRQDIAVSSSVSFSAYVISVFRNVSSGGGNISLAPRIDLPMFRISSIGSGDIDGDDKLDIVAVGDSDVGILRNTGVGVGDISFAVPFEYRIGPFGSVAVQDFDGDGKKDIAMVSGSLIVILRNIRTAVGSINFAALKTFAGFSDPIRMISTDVDGDGRFDLITANKRVNSVSILQNTSQTPGEIAFATRKWDFGTGFGPEHLAVGDLTQDGKPEIVTANFYANSVSILPNLSESSVIDFAARKDYLGPGSRNVTSVTSGDLDEDGDVDVAASFQNFSGYSIFINNGDGHFSTRNDYPLQSFTPISIVSSDFDGDGKLDLAAQTSTEVRVLRNSTSGSGGLAFELSNFAWPFVSFPVRPSDKIQIADLNNDGKMDILVIGGEQVDVLRNVSTGDANISFLREHGFTRPSDSPLAIADIDGDGKPDIAYSTYSSRSIRIERSTHSDSGPLSFAQQDIEVPTVRQTKLRLLSDMDGDLRPDFITADPEHIEIIRNMSMPGAVSLGTVTSFLFQFALPDIAADFDRDSRIDFLSARSMAYTESIAVLKNISSESTLQLQNSGYLAYGGNGGVSPNRSSLAVADFDGDGRLDIAAGSYGLYGSVSILLRQACAVPVTISGRVMTPGGMALRNVIVTLIDENGTRRTAWTSSFGVYQFTDVPVGRTYILSPNSKRYRFAPRQVTAGSGMSDLNFVGLE